MQHARMAPILMNNPDHFLMRCWDDRTLTQRCFSCSLLSTSSCCWCFLLETRAAHRSDGAFYQPPRQHFLCWPTCVDRFQQPFLCLFSPSAPLLWPLCLSSLSPAAGAPPAPWNAPPADVSPLLSGNNDRLATLAFDWSL